MVAVDKLSRKATVNMPSVRIQGHLPTSNRALYILVVYSFTELELCMMVGWGSTEKCGGVGRCEMTKQTKLG